MASTEKDFNQRKGLAWPLDKIWKAAHLTVKLKINILKASVWSILLYGCETWTINETLANKINSFATSCFRIILNIKKLDKIPNLDIYRTINEDPLIHTVHQRQLRWIGHALRKDKNEPTRIFALYEPVPSHGKTKRGKQKQTHLEYISSILTSEYKDISAKKLEELASDRVEWRKRTVYRRKR